MESECNCPGCGETFVDPRVLPCKHVYCVTCVEKMSKTPVDLSDPSKGTKSCCFLCETAFTLAKGDPESLPQSEQHLDLIETYKETTAFVSFSCEGHADKEAVKRCLSGCGHVCQECISAHNTAKGLRGHQLVDIDKSQAVLFETACSKHVQSFVDFCPKENQDNPFLCGSCVGQHLRDMGNHPHEEYLVGAKKLCDSLGENKKKITQISESVIASEKKNYQKRAEIENYIGNLKKNAAEKFEGARKMINDEEKRFMQKIDDFHEKIVQPYRSLGGYLVTLKKHLDYSEKLVSDSLKVFNEGKSPVKLPLAKKLSNTILLKNIPPIPETIDEFTEEVPVFTISERNQSNGNLQSNSII